MGRSVWKTLYLHTTFILQAQQLKQTGKKEIIMVNRSTVITPQMLGLTVQVYNGMSFFPVVIENDMIGHCLGEFAATRKKAKKKK